MGWNGTLKFRVFVIVILCCFLRYECSSQWKNAYVEIGSPFVGLEFHNGNPAPQRISYYYPVGNSVDNMTDYMTRDRTHVFFVGVSVNNSKVPTWVSLSPFDITEWTPLTVNYTRTFDELGVTVDIAYRFSGNSSIAVVYFSVVQTKSGTKTLPIRLTTRLLAELRTCHDYTIMVPSKVSFFDKKDYTSATAAFCVEDTHNTEVFVVNAEGVAPSKHGEDLTFFEYEFESVGSVKVTQLWGSVKCGEAESIVSKLVKDKQFEKEIREFEEYVDYWGVERWNFDTGDEVVQRTVDWARKILEVDAHYMDGWTLPMPCPAEYNFFFTHDTLMTDMAAVLFDRGRVKSNLQFIGRHSDKDSHVIPHAYYWLENEYNTEWCEPTNWNHMWFLIVTGRYFRHTGDTETVKDLIPMLRKSSEFIKGNQHKDGTIWSHMPDWWDIGENHASRTYHTILSTRALREYNFLCKKLDFCTNYEMNKTEHVANSLKDALNNKLWIDDAKYLLNFMEDGSLDEHYYIGSLLAVYFGLLPEERSSDLTNTATKYLLDPKIGVYNAFPMDFQEKKWIDAFRFGGNLACDPGLYLNGAIWEHGNAWYALALIEHGKIADALDFIKRVMCIDGVEVLAGQPAMYEYRNSINAGNWSVYGRVDKPEFMWAAGWFLHALYHVYGVKENDWNIGFRVENWDPEILKPSTRIRLLLGGELTTVSIIGSGSTVCSVSFDNGESIYPSAVVPSGKIIDSTILLTLGSKVSIPMVIDTESEFIGASFNEETLVMTVRISAFVGHASFITIISPFPSTAFSSSRRSSDDYIVKVPLIHKEVEETVDVHFEKV